MKETDSIIDENKVCGGADQPSAFLLLPTDPLAPVTLSFHAVQLRERARVRGEESPKLADRLEVLSEEINAWQKAQEAGKAKKIGNLIISERTGNVHIYDVNNGSDVTFSESDIPAVIIGLNKVKAQLPGVAEV